MSPTLLKEQEVAMLRAEVEMLINERQSLLDTTGAAAVFIANLDSQILPDDAFDAAEMLSKSINKLPEETLRDALEKVKKSFITSE